MTAIDLAALTAAPMSMSLFNAAYAKTTPAFRCAVAAGKYHVQREARS